MMSHYLAMFDGHWSSAREDINNLICHVILQKHVIEGSSNFITLHLPKFGGHSYCSSTGIILVSQVIKQDLKIRVS